MTLLNENLTYLKDLLTNDWSIKKEKIFLNHLVNNFNEIKNDPDYITYLSNIINIEVKSYDVLPFFRVIEELLRLDEENYFSNDLTYLYQVSLCYLKLLTLANENKYYLKAISYGASALVYLFKCIHEKDLNKFILINKSVYEVYRSLSVAFDKIGDKKRALAFQKASLNPNNNSNPFDYNETSYIYIKELMFYGFKNIDNFEGMSQAITAILDELPEFVRLNQLSNDHFLLLENLYLGQEALMIFEKDLNEKDLRIKQHYENVKFYLNDYAFNYDLTTLLEYFLICVTFKKDDDFIKIYNTLAKLSFKNITGQQAFLLSKIYSKLGYSFDVYQKDYLNAVSAFMKAYQFGTDYLIKTQDFTSLPFISYSYQHCANCWEQLNDVDHAREAIKQACYGFKNCFEKFKSSSYLIDLFYCLTSFAKLNYSIRCSKNDLEIYEYIFKLEPLIKEYGEDEDINDLMNIISNQYKMVLNS